MRVTRTATVTVTMDEKRYQQLLSYLKDYRAKLGPDQSMASQAYRESLEALLDGLDAL